MLQQILQNHGYKALVALAGRVPSCVWEAAWHALDLMSTCRTPAAGFVRLRCETCGETKTIAFTCKSRLCPCCGWLAGQRLIETMQPRLIKCGYRHVVFSVPSELRELFFWERQLLPQACHAAAAATVECFQGLCKRYDLLPGIIGTCHTFGSDLHFHVHVHLLVTEGALQLGGVWQPVHYFPAGEFRRRWQYHLLTRLRQKLPADHPAQRTIGRLFRRYPTGFIVNLESRYRHVRQALQYCCRYLARPPLGEGRILAYDGRYVVFEHKDYKAGQLREKRCTAVSVVKLLLQHVLPRYARNIHYYGLYHPQTRRRWFDEVRRVSRYPQNVGGPATRALSWRERIIQAFKVDPVLCPGCGTAMVVDEVRWPAPRRAPPTHLPLGLPLTAGRAEAPARTVPFARSASARRAV